MTLTDPGPSLQALQAELGKFEEVMGFKVNLSKSFILNLTIPEGEALQLWGQTSFQWAKHSLQNVGIQLTPEDRRSV